MQEAIDHEAKQKEKEESKIKPSVDERLLDILEANQKTIDKAIPEDGTTKAEKQLAAQEDNYRYHKPSSRFRGEPVLRPDTICVFEVSMSAIDKIDGTNGWHDIVTGSDESRELGLSDRVELTKEGLVITDRFEVKMHRLPTEDWHCEYVLVGRKEWEESRTEAVGAMLGDNEQFGDIMIRSGMDQ